MNKLTKILARILEIDERKINNQTSPQNTPTWDSYNALLMVSEIEDAFGKNFTMTEVMKVKNVGDIKKVLRRHGVKI
ncbi:MAG: acyl carrier protein [Parcubacteria group bacterium]|nr:acyl carrier protein [Parcubacteria group bacterium]